MFYLLLFSPGGELFMNFIKTKFFREPLNVIEGHLKLPDMGIDRLVASGLPVHIAVHKIDLETKQEVYCTPHSHGDEDELNIIINDNESELSYRFIIDENDFTYSAPACIWIPSNKMHSANAVKGRGTFICIRFPSGVLEKDE